MACVYFSYKEAAKIAKSFRDRLKKTEFIASADELNYHIFEVIALPADRVAQEEYAQLIADSIHSELPDGFLKDNFIEEKLDEFANRYETGSYNIVLMAVAFLGDDETVLSVRMRQFVSQEGIHSGFKVDKNLTLF